MIQQFVEEWTLIISNIKCLNSLFDLEEYKNKFDC